MIIGTNTAAVPMGSKNNISVAFGNGAEPSPVPTENLMVWYDADDSDTIAETSGALDSWGDRSGNGNGLSQSGSARPTYTLNAQNGKPVIRFDGSDDYLQLATWASGTITQPFTIFAVWSYPADNAFRYVVDGGSAANRNYIVVDKVSSVREYNINEIKTSGDPPPSSCRQYTYFFDGASSDLRRNESSILSGDFNTIDSGGITFARRYDTSDFSAIDVAEVLIYEAELSDSDRDDIEEYLIDKWDPT